jgi:hypothetical protein
VRFYLTTHKRWWVEATDVPLFLKFEHFGVRTARHLPRAVTRYSVDSGGFTILQRHGAWTVTPRAYVEDLRRIRDEVGPFDWAAPQDWMCEPIMIHGGTAGNQVFVGTHLSIVEHQRRTVANYTLLREMAPELPIIPVVQGWEISDYERCVDLYAREGIDLTHEPVVGLGSVCRRQSTREGAAIVTALAGHGLKLHGFGFKTLGLQRVGHLMASADSLAWSTHARHRPAMPGHTHKNCANCLPYALNWRDRALAALPPWHQPSLGT